MSLLDKYTNILSNMKQNSEEIIILCEEMILTSKVIIRIMNMIIILIINMIMIIIIITMMIIMIMVMIIIIYTSILVL